MWISTPFPKSESVKPRLARAVCNSILACSSGVMSVGASLWREASDEKELSSSITSPPFTTHSASTASRSLRSRSPHEGMTRLLRVLMPRPLPGYCFSTSLKSPAPSIRPPNEPWRGEEEARGEDRMVISAVGLALIE